MYHNRKWQREKVLNTQKGRWSHEEPRHQLTSGCLSVSQIMFSCPSTLQSCIFLCWSVTKSPDEILPLVVKCEKLHGVWIILLLSGSCYVFLSVCQGTSWLHVGTDQPFKSISVGAASQVWGVARDGSAFYRGSVSGPSPAGQQEDLRPSENHELNITKNVSVLFKDFNTDIKSSQLKEAKYSNLCCFWLKIA